MQNPATTSGMSSIHIALSRYARLLAGAPPPHPAIWRPQDKENSRPDLTEAGKVWPGGDSGVPSATAVAKLAAAALAKTDLARSAAGGAGEGVPSSVLVRLPSPELGESDDDHLSDVDDDIGSYLITDSKEVKAKEEIWMSMNAEFLEAQEEKAKREKEDELLGRGPSTATRKKRKNAAGDAGSAVFIWKKSRRFRSKNCGTYSLFLAISKMSMDFFGMLDRRRQPCKPYRRNASARRSTILCCRGCSHSHHPQSPKEVPL